MKRSAFLLLLLSVFLPLALQAQKEQDPDTLRWNNRRYAVTVHRDVPSILMVYYQRTASEAPFQFWSSSNNRGHIASFEILNEQICLTRIEAKRYHTNDRNAWAATGIDTVVSPDYFNIKPLKAEQPFGEGPVLADWFSGVVELSLLPADKKEQKSDEARGRRLLYIREGRVVQNCFISDKEYKTLSTKHLSEITDNQLREKKELLETQSRFVNFYTRCAIDRETVRMQTHEGRFDRRANSLTLVMDFFGNDPMHCTTNWENVSEDSGAPFGSWLLSGDSLFLVSINTHSGTDLYKYDEHPEDINSYLSGSDGASKTTADGSRRFAHWLNGTFVIHYGDWQVDEFGVHNYVVSKTQEIRVKEGVVYFTKFSPRSFDDDMEALRAEEFTVCNEAEVWSVDDKQLAENVGKYKSPKKSPEYKGGKDALRNYFIRKTLTDQRAKERLFRVRIGFMVNCKGQAGQWQLLNKGKGELFEFANMVLDIVKNMPQNWQPATDKKGNPVDCWQILEFTVSNGDLSSASYK